MMSITRDGGAVAGDVSGLPHLLMVAII